jgi:hypothetical protein
MKTLKLCGLAVLSGLLIGVFVGWHFGRTITDGRLIWEEMFAGAGHGQLALLQYDQADPEHARQALLSDTNFSKSIAKLPSAQGDKALLIDTGRNYLRLAALEQLAGNNSLSHQYVLNAQESFRSMGRDIPEEKLNQEVAKITARAQQNVPPS